MKKTIQVLMSATLLIAGVLFTPIALSPTAQAVNVYKGCNNNVDSAVCGSKGDSLKNLLNTAVKTLLFVVSSIAVIMIVVSGIKFATANGDSGAIKSARDTILYSVIGLVVAVMAWAIVDFVIDRFVG